MTPSHAVVHRAAAFTLIELLVVISIIALLIAVLLPALASARQSARTVKCQANIRGLGQAMINYAVDQRGAFPANGQPVLQPTTLWYHEKVIGPYFPSDTVTGSGNVGGSAFVCPDDIVNAKRSYTVNYYSSSLNRGSAVAYPLAAAYPERFFNLDRATSSLILVVEHWSYLGDATNGWYASFTLNPTIGSQTCTPYQMFVDYPLSAGRLATTPSESRIEWGRHSDTGNPYRAVGLANFAMADGHVSSYQPDALVDRVAQRSKYKIQWTPVDLQME